MNIESIIDSAQRALQGPAEILMREQAALGSLQTTMGWAMLAGAAVLVAQSLLVCVRGKGWDRDHDLANVLSLTGGIVGVCLVVPGLCALYEGAARVAAPATYLLRELA